MRYNLTRTSVTSIRATPRNPWRALGCWRRKRFRRPGGRKRNWQPHSVVYHELCDHCLRVESRQKIERLALVSHRLHHLLVCGGVAADEVHLHRGLRGFRDQRLFLDAAGNLIPPAHSGALLTIC